MEQKQNKIKYTWDPNADFNFKGIEFNMLYNNLQNYLNGLTTPISVMRIVEAFELLTRKLDEAIENGVAVEEKK